MMNNKHTILNPDESNRPIIIGSIDDEVPYLPFYQDAVNEVFMIHNTFFNTSHIIDYPSQSNVTKNQRKLLQPRDEFVYDIGRNQPCPCGSGVKFKKCCYQIKKSNNP